MRALNILASVMLGLCLIQLLYPKLPYIILPKGIQHNTIGELPLFEVIDDGDFYEEDGKEDKIFQVTTKTGEKLWVRY